MGVLHAFSMERQYEQGLMYEKIIAALSVNWPLNAK